MEHINLSFAWKFNENPFPAYRCNLNYGDRWNQRAFEFLSVNGVTPLRQGIEVSSEQTLPKGEFRLTRTRKGTILVVGGRDDTKRCLLFVGCSGGDCGGVQVLQSGTTGAILKSCAVGNATDSEIQVIAHLNIGESVAFFSYGKQTHEVYQYVWDGGLKVKHLSKNEWYRQKEKTAADWPPLLKD